MRIIEYIKRIQNLPLIKRKIIFWAIIIIFVLILLTFWVISVQQTIKIFPKGKFLEEMKLPNLKEELENLPKPEFPKSEIEGVLKELEGIKEKAE